jgi:hypothetical protein
MVVRKILLGTSRICSLIRRITKETYDDNRYNPRFGDPLADFLHFSKNRCDDR